MTPPPPTRPGALKKPMGSAEKGAMAPITPPKAGSPATSPARASTAAATAGSGVIPTPTPKSPPPIGLSPASSPTTPPPSSKEKSSSPGKGGESTEGSERKRKRSRTPLSRRPQGKKQRARFEKGNYGDQRVKFANPIDNRGQGGDSERRGGKDKGKQPGKGKGKSKGKSKGKPKGKGKDKSKKEDAKQKESRAPGGGDGKEKKN